MIGRPSVVASNWKSTAHTVFGKLCVRTPNEAERAVLGAAQAVDATASVEDTAAPAIDSPSADDEYVVPRQPVGSNA